MIKPFSLYILSALAAGEAHAYAIEKQMQSDVRGAVPITSRRIYRDLTRLLQEGLIAEASDARPARYRLTTQGRRILAAEREQALHTYRILQERL